MALKILVVDDEDLIRWSLQRGLVKRGHSVAEAANAQSALAALAEAADPFDVVLLDYRLPDRQDLTLLADVRRLSPGTRVFMMTAYGDNDMRTGALASGVRAVVDKPFRVNEFIDLVESAERH